MRFTILIVTLVAELIQGEKVFTSNMAGPSENIDGEGASCSLELSWMIRDIESKGRPELVLTET